VRSAPAQGSSFQVYLPTAAPAPEKQKAAPVPVPVASWPGRSA